MAAEMLLRIQNCSLGKLGLHTDCRYFSSGQLKSISCSLSPEVGALGVLGPSAVGERALLGVLLLPGPPTVFVLGEACLTRVCLRGSALTAVASPAVLVGVVSLDPLPLPVPVAGLTMVVVLCLVARVAFLPLGSSVVITSSPFPSPRSSEFLWEMAVWILVEKVVVMSPTSLRDVLVRPMAGGERYNI